MTMMRGPLQRTAGSASRLILLAVTTLGWPLVAAQNAPLPPPPPAGPGGAIVPPPPPAGDIREIVPAQPYFLPINYVWLAIGLLSLLLAAWVLWYYFVRPRLRRPAVPLTPREAALKRLQELEAKSDALEPRVFGGEVGEVLRSYIGAQFSLHPERQTSPEFLNSITHASVFSNAEKALLGEFLQQTDLLKFARHDATREAKKHLLEQAREFVGPAQNPEAAPFTPVPGALTASGSSGGASIPAARS